MKVVCIDNSQLPWNDGKGLTLNKVYEAINKYDLTNGSLEITDDLGEKRGYAATRFRKLDEIREEKLLRLLDTDAG